MRLRDRFYHCTVETIYGPVNRPVRVHPGESPRAVAASEWDADELLTGPDGRARMSASRITLAEYDHLTH